MAKNLVRDLVHRRVPQLLGIYLGASWVVIEFVGMLVDRYLLSPHLVDLSIVLLASLIPTVVLLAYFHGAAGRDGWTRTEKFFIPANLVVSAALLAALFSGKELGATTETRVLEDEEGNTVERIVAKPEFRKHAALYFFENESGDSTLDWVRFGIDWALDIDLSQDLFLNIESIIPEPGSRLAEAGFPDGVGVPLPLKRELARERNRKYFIDGSFSWDGEAYTIHSRLHETARGVELATQSAEGSDFFALIDQLSVQLRQDLGIGEQHIEASVDLPVSERLSGSIPAYRLAMLGVREMYRNDSPSARRFWAKAVEEDPTFALAQVLLGFAYFETNQQEEADRAWQAGLQHVYRLPERGSYGQLSLKAWLYLFMGEDTKALQTAEYAAELYPDDMWAHEQLAEIYAYRRRWEDVIREQRAIYALDSSRTGALLEIGNAHERLGQFEQAEEDYRRYLELKPEDAAAHRALGFVYRLMGEHERARSAYERAAVIDPEDTGPYLQLARVALALGEFDAASAARDRALAAARSAPDSASVFGFDESSYYAKGQYAKLVEAYQLRLAAILRYTPPASAPWEALGSEALLYAAEWGEERFALGTLDSLSAEIPERFRNAASHTYLQIYLELEDAENATRELARLRAAYEARGVQESPALHGEARLLEIVGDCESAIPLYQETVQRFPVSSFHSGWHADLGRCLRKLRRFEEAEEALNHLLKQVPAQPYGHYELALVYADTDRRDEAIAHLETALAVWAEADPRFRPAQRARERLTALTSG